MNKCIMPKRIEEFRISKKERLRHKMTEYRIEPDLFGRYLEDP
jgi:hypothetical protein